MELYGWSGAYPLKGRGVKGWVGYIGTAGRVFVFNETGRFMLWGYGSDVPLTDARTLAAFLPKVTKPHEQLPNNPAAGGWFLSNCRVAFHPTDADRTTSLFLAPNAGGWDLSRFVRMAIPGCADDPEMIIYGVLGLLAAAPLVDVAHYHNQVIRLREWAYSLPNEVRNNPDNYTPRLWQDFDKHLASVEFNVSRSLPPAPKANTLEYWYKRREELNNQIALVETEIIRLGGST